MISLGGRGRGTVFFLFFLFSCGGCADQEDLIGGLGFFPLSISHFCKSTGKVDFILLFSHELLFLPTSTPFSAHFLVSFPPSLLSLAQSFFAQCSLTPYCELPWARLVRLAWNRWDGHRTLRATRTITFSSCFPALRLTSERVSGRKALSVVDSLQPPFSQTLSQCTAPLLYHTAP